MYERDSCDVNPSEILEAFRGTHDEHSVSRSMIEVVAARCIRLPLNAAAYAEVRSHVITYIIKCSRESCALA